MWTELYSEIQTLHLTSETKQAESGLQLLCVLCGAGEGWGGTRLVMDDDGLCCVKTGEDGREHWELIPDCGC